MRKNIISALFSSLVILMAACSSDMAGDPESPAASGGSILRLEIDKEDLTRSGIDSTSFDEGDEVFVVVKDRENPDILTVTTKATYTKGKWNLADKINLAGSISGVAWTKADLQVIYPYDLAAEGYDKESGKINLSFSQTDILYGQYNGLTKENPNAKVNCWHEMTRLTLALNNTSDKSISFGKVKIVNEGYQSFLGSKGYIYDKGVDVTDYCDTITVNKGWKEISAGKTEYYDILLPQTTDVYRKMLDLIKNEGIEKTVLKFELELKDRTVNFDIDAGSWINGHQYIYPVKLSATSKPDYGNHEYVDLGLSVKWATCNVGASSPSDYGDYFAWGETTPKSEYTEENHRISSSIGDFSGNPKYDAATYNWGDRWRMPTKSELEELSSKCNWIWTDVESKVGYTVVGPNGNSIFLPAAGYYHATSLSGLGEYGFYRCSDPIEAEYGDNGSIGLRLKAGAREVSFFARFFGFSVRPVSD